MFKEFDFALRAGKSQNNVTLERGWSDVAYKVIYEASKIKCPLSLKFKSKKIIAEGFCPDKNCEPLARLELLTWKHDLIKLKVEIENYSEHFEHAKKKRRIRNKLREKYRKTLTTTNPYNLTNKLAADNWREGKTFYPAHMPDLSVVQKISSENRKPPGQVTKNIFEFDLREEILKHFQVEKEVSITFWHKLQTNFYVNFAKKNYVIVSIDDTGNIINNLHGDSKCCDELNLFQIQLQNIDHKSYPVGQMLSSRKNADTIVFFFLNVAKGI